MPPAVSFGTAVDDAEWSMAFVGDVLLDDGMAESPVDSSVADRVRGADVALANVEAPVPGSGAPAPKSGPHKQQRAGATETVADAGFDVACLANNHVMDYGVGGLRATVDACADAGLATVGAGDSPTAALTPYTASVRDRSVAVVNLCEREFGVADEDGGGAAWVGHPDARRVVSDAAGSHDAVVVVAHGGVEYVPFPPASRQRALRAFVDAGADAVVGHHPHVPQGWEVYDGAPILYSLGNFLFSMSDRTSTQWGLVAELAFRGEDDRTDSDRVDGARVERGTAAGARVSGVRLTLTQQTGGRVTRMDEGRRDRHREYVDRVSTTTADRDALRAHWQELADRLFDQRYAGWLRTGTASGTQQTVTAPGAAFGDAFDGDTRAAELLTLLNVVRNESHRDVIETALAVRTGEATDRRTEDVERRVRELLSWTEDRPMYDRPSLPEKVLRAARRRL